MSAAAERLREVFAPVGGVDVRRMFGGHGVFRDAAMIAIEAGGTIYLKADAETAAAFDAAGCAAFAYRKGDREVLLGFRELPAEAHEDVESLRLWVGLAEAAARRALFRRPQGRGRAPDPR